MKTMEDKRVIDMTAGDLAQLLGGKVMVFKMEKDRNCKCNCSGSTKTSTQAENRSIGTTTALESDTNSLMKQLYGVNVAGHYQGKVIPAVTTMGDITYLVFPNINATSSDEEYNVRRYDIKGSLISESKMSAPLLLPLLGIVNLSPQEQMRNSCEEFKQFAKFNVPIQDIHGLVKHTLDMAQFTRDILGEYNHAAVSMFDLASVTGDSILVGYAKADAENTAKMYEEEKKAKLETLEELCGRAFDVAGYTFLLQQVASQGILIITINKQFKDKLIIKRHVESVDSLLDKIQPEGLFLNEIILNVDDSREMVDLELEIVNMEFEAIKVEVAGEVHSVSSIFRVNTPDCSEEIAIIQPTSHAPNTFRVCAFDAYTGNYIIKDKWMTAVEVLALWKYRANNPDISMEGTQTGRVKTDKPNTSNTPKKEITPDKPMTTKSPAVKLKKFDKIRWRHDGKNIYSIVQAISHSELDMETDMINQERRDGCRRAFISFKKTIDKLKYLEKKDSVRTQLNKVLNIFRYNTMVLLVDCDDSGTRRVVLLDKLINKGVEVANSAGEFEHKAITNWGEIAEHLRYTQFNSNGMVFVIREDVGGGIFEITACCGPDGINNWTTNMPQEAIMAMIGKNKVTPRMVPGAPRREYQYFQIVNKKIQFGPNVVKKRTPKAASN